MDEVARIPSRIVLNGSSSISLSDRFRQIKPALRSNRKMGLRGEPRNFLYDDYMEEEHEYGGRSGGRRDFGIGGGSSSRGRPSRDLDMGLDEYSRVRRPTEGLLRRRDQLLDDFGGTDGQARRFASAMGISSARAQPVYDDLDYEPVPRGRLQQVVYRQRPTRPQVMRRVVDDYVESPRVVQVVERIRQPQRRIQVVKRVPIQQRVVKRIVVQKVGTRSGGKRTSFGGSSALRGRVQQRAQGGRRNGGGSGGGVLKKKVQRGGGGGKRDNKPKISAADLDRELDEYMKSSKHPRVEV